MPVAPAITASESAPAKDYKIPAILIGVGVLISLLHALAIGGAAALAHELLALPLELIFKIIVGVVACLITSKIMGTAFGYAGSAILKLAAVFTLPAAVALFIPIVGWIVALLLYWALLEWLFELDVFESIIFVLVIWATSAVAAMLFAALLVIH